MRDAAVSLILEELDGSWIKEGFLGSGGKIDVFNARVLKDFKYTLYTRRRPGGQDTPGG